MGTRPAAEVDVTPELVQALLREQHPDLAGLPLRPVTAGWDNVLLRLGDRLAVRVPRRAAAAALVGHEQRWLPELGARLAVATPVPVRVGRPSATFPWAWSVVPWFDGVSAAGVPAAARTALARPPVDAVVALHRPAPPGGTGHSPPRAGRVARCGCTATCTPPTSSSRVRPDDVPGGATWERARGWALVLATAMLAHSDDDPRLPAVGRHALAEALDD